MEKLGFFKEYTDNRILPALLDYELNVYYEQKEDILKYLKSGVRILYVRGVVDCVVNSDKMLVPHECIYTDGVWIWSEAIIYYLQYHNIKLPENFLLHLQGVEFVINNNVQKDVLAEVGAIATKIITGNTDW